jgi:hypothetical protein
MLKGCTKKQHSHDDQQWFHWQPRVLPVTTPMKTILIGSIISPRTTVTFIPASQEYFKYSDSQSKVFMLHVNYK